MSVYYNDFEPFACDWLRELIAAGELPDGVVDGRSILDIKPSEVENYTQAHYFCGLGGWPLAFSMAGQSPQARVWSGSPPCQSFSFAGKQKGKDDERHLWPVFFELIKACKPDAVTGEQVEAAIRFGWLDDVKRDLESVGYEFAATVLPASAVSAPHIRSRIFWCGRLPRKWAFSDGESLRRPGAAVVSGADGRQTQGDAGSGGDGTGIRPQVEDPDHARRDDGDETERRGAEGKGGVGKPDSTGERLQGSTGAGVQGSGDGLAAHGGPDGVANAIGDGDRGCGPGATGAEAGGVQGEDWQLEWVRLNPWASRAATDRLADSRGPASQRDARGLPSPQGGVGGSGVVDGDRPERPEHGGATDGMADPGQVERRCGEDECRPHGQDATERGEEATDDQRRGTNGGVGDAAVLGHRRAERRAFQGGPGDAGPEPLGQLPNGPARSGGFAGRGGLADGEGGRREQVGSDSRGRVEGGGEEGGERPEHGSGTSIGMGHADAGRLGETDALPRRPAAVGGVPGTPTANFWADSELVYCRDGKWRRIPRQPKSGFQSLAARLPEGLAGLRLVGSDSPEEEAERVAEEIGTHPLARTKVVGRANILKGAGNSVVAPLTALFVKAFLETCLQDASTH